MTITSTYAEMILDDFHELTPTDFMVLSTSLRSPENPWTAEQLEQLAVRLTRLKTIVNRRKRKLITRGESK